MCILRYWFKYHQASLVEYSNIRIKGGRLSLVEHPRKDTMFQALCLIPRWKAEVFRLNVTWVKALTRFSENTGIQTFQETHGMNSEILVGRPCRLLSISLLQLSSLKHRVNPATSVSSHMVYFTSFSQNSFEQRKRSWRLQWSFSGLWQWTQLSDSPVLAPLSPLLYLIISND